MIREYTPDDIVYIEEIGKIVHPQYKFMINQYTKCLVYVIDNKILAFVVYYIMYEKTEIIDIAVLPEYQNQDIGTKLLDSVIKDCITKGCESVSLEVRPSNNMAIQFYRKHGFREASVRRNYYSDGEDALVMVKML